MFCQFCGGSLPHGALHCPACGKPVAGPAGPMAYAGFWLRLVAWLVDSIILNVAFGVVFILLAVVFGVLVGALATGEPRGEDIVVMAIGLYYLIALLSIPAAWLYFALMESSSWQATLGKRMLGLVVTDLDGNRISFGRATGRWFGKILSSLILGIGFVMAGFTEKKQALHDHLASCLVVRRS